MLATDTHFSVGRCLLNLSDDLRIRYVLQSCKLRTRRGILWVPCFQIGKTEVPKPVRSFKVRVCIHEMPLYTRPTLSWTTKVDRNQAREPPHRPIVKLYREAKDHPTGGACP